MPWLVSTAETKGQRSRDSYFAAGNTSGRIPDGECGLLGDGFDLNLIGANAGGLQRAIAKGNPAIDDRRCERTGEAHGDFRVALGGSSRNYCALQVLINGTPEPALTFGAAWYSSGIPVSGEALVTIPDNATIEVGLAGYNYCDFRIYDGSTQGARAFVTVMKIG